MKKSDLMNNIFKILTILSLPLLLNACGGSGGGGGGAGGGAGYTVPSCSGDSSTYTTAEYNYMGGASDAGTGAGKYGLGSVCAGAAYARGATGDGILIAVLDSGISVGSGSSTDVTDIDANIASFLTGSDVVNSDNVPQDDDNNGGTAIGSGHGSHVAGIIASEKNNSGGLHGVAYDSTLHIIKVLDSDGNGSATDIAAGMDLARGVSSMDIVNISIGGSTVTGSSSCNSASSCETNLGSTLYTAMEALGAANIITVYAAGNSTNSSPSSLAGAAIYDDDFKETMKLIEKIDGTVVGFAFIIELLDLKGREKIKEYRSESLVEY